MSITHYYPHRHLAPTPVKDGFSWQNDGQNYIHDKENDVWRTWALGCPEWTPDSGFPMTSWISYSGDSLTTMKPDEPSVFIDRNSALGDTYWSGSVFVDENNVLGRGEGYVYYFISGLDPVMQGISLLVAPKLGEIPYNLGMCCSPEIVPEDIRDSGRNFRDARVFWDEENEQLVMATTIGNRFMFLSSTNGSDWTYLSYLQGPGPLVECPNILRLPVYDQNNNVTGKKWAILGAVQGHYLEGTDSDEVCASWIGNWDGVSFTPDDPEPTPMDYGPDSYATVAGEKGDEKFMGFWLGSWSYSLLPSPYEGFQNIQGFPRQIVIGTDNNGKQRIFQMPVVDNEQNANPNILPNQTINAQTPYNFGDLTFDKFYRLDVNLSQVNGQWPSATTISVKVGKGFHTDLTIFEDGTVVFDRAQGGLKYPGWPQAPVEQWIRRYSIPSSLGLANNSNMTVTLLIDSSSIEAFFNGGQASLSGLVFAPEKGCDGVEIKSTDDVSVTAFLSSY